MLINRTLTVNNESGVQLPAIWVYYRLLTLDDLWPTFQGHVSTPFSIAYHSSIISTMTLTFDLGWPLTYFSRSSFNSILDYLPFEYNVDIWPWVTFDDLWWPWPWPRKNFVRKFFLDEKYFLGLRIFFGGRGQKNFDRKKSWKKKLDLENFSGAGPKFFWA